MEIIVFCVISEKNSIKRNFNSLVELGLKPDDPECKYSKMINNGIVSDKVLIKSKYLYMRVSENKKNVNNEKIVKDIDVYFNGELIVSGCGFFDEDLKMVTITDASDQSMSFYFNYKMWKELTIIN